MAAVHKRSAVHQNFTHKRWGIQQWWWIYFYFLNMFLYVLVGQEAKLTMFCTFQHGSQLVFELIWLLILSWLKIWCYRGLSFFQKHRSYLLRTLLAQGEWPEISECCCCSGQWSWFIQSVLLLSITVCCLLRNMIYIYIIYTYMICVLYLFATCIWIFVVIYIYTYGLLH